MKKITLLIIAFSLLASLFVLNVNAADKNEYKYVVENGEVTITNYFTRGKVVEIPSEIEGSPVTKIAEHSMESLPNVEKIVIPDTVSEIEHCAFSSILYLKELVLPEKEVKVTGFPLCNSGLREIDIPDTWKSIPDGLFAHLQSLVNVDIPNGIVNIGSNAFHNCTHLAHVSIPDSVEYIGENAFFRTQIRVLRLPASLKSIEKFTLLANGFEDQSLEIVAVPKSVTEIKANSGITSVKEIYYEGTKEDWDKIQKDKVTANAELNIVFEKYPNADEMPKLEPVSTPMPTPVPTPMPFDLKLNAPILAYEANTKSLNDQSGRGYFRQLVLNEEKEGYWEFVKDEETGLTVSHSKYARADYDMYYFRDVFTNYTCEMYFKIARKERNAPVYILRLDNKLLLDENSKDDLIPQEVLDSDIPQTWIRVTGRNTKNTASLAPSKTMNQWVHFTYVRKDNIERFYVNGYDVTGAMEVNIADLSSLGIVYLGGDNSIGKFDTEQYFAYLRVYAGAASPEWVKKMYDNRNTPYDPKNPTVPTIEGETVVGVQEETTKETLMDFVYDSENSDIVTCEGTALAPTALVGTGAKLTSDGDEYSVVVKKDVSGDGKISSIDYLKLKKHFSGNTLSGIYQKAGDSNCDDRITSADYLLIKRYFAAK